MKAAPRAVLLLGPTACGKSAAAMALARHRPVEIISVDSAQVYRGMDVGTAKPDLRDRESVPHHLIDIRDPHQPYDAATFAGDALALISAITARGRLPLLVGGTMLYARALLQPLDDLPRADPSLRHALDAEAAEQGWPAMHRQLAAIDPQAAARIAPNDSQRIQRALEVHRLTGEPLSAHWIRQRNGEAAGGPAPLFVVSLETPDRAWLHRRIEARFLQMLAAGLVAEVERLRQDPRNHAALPAMRSVGYRQAWQYLDDVQEGSIDTAQLQRRLLETGVAATRQLAKRQFTWLRSLPVHHRIDALSADPVAALRSAVDEALGPRPFKD